MHLLNLETLRRKLLDALEDPTDKRKRLSDVMRQHLGRLGDRLIALALAHPFAAHRFMDFTPIFPVVCIGKIQQEVRLPDGRFNMLLQGLARARITSEFETGKLSLEQLRSLAINMGEPQTRSGKQEYLENLINRFI